MLGKMFVLFERSSVYVFVLSQESWIQQMSFRDNILFDKIYDEQWYKKVIHACALESDIKVRMTDIDHKEKLFFILSDAESWSSWRSNIDW